jgi:acetate kinase
LSCLYKRGQLDGLHGLDGLMMSTRCGQLDPGVVMQQRGMSAHEAEAMLYKESGLHQRGWQQGVGLGHPHR